MIRAAAAAKTRATEGFWEGTLSYPHAFLTMVMALGIGAVFHRMIGYRSMPLPLVWFAAASLVAILSLGANRPDESGRPLADRDSVRRCQHSHCFDSSPTGRRSHGEDHPDEVWGS